MMTKGKWIIGIFLLCCAIPVRAEKPVLRFQDGREFKIAHLTDLHFRGQKPEEAVKTFARMDHIVATEHPDLIAITGDALTGAKDSQRMLTDIIARLESYETPWCLVFGNHDEEQGIPRPEMSAQIAGARFNINTLNAAGELADVCIPVLPHDGSAKGVPAWNLYFMDSHDATDPKEDGSGWFTFDQVQWLSNTCREQAALADSVNIPSLAFFHIPLPEYREAWMDAHERHRSRVKGIRGEDECVPPINTGMFAAMYDSGSFVGVFCGHDHNNDYIVSHHDIALVYGRFSGDNTTYNALRRGVRIISLPEGSRSFTTWIHEDDDNIAMRYTFNNGKIE